MFKNDPTGFRDHYIALMKNGFDDTPRHLLKKFLDIDLDDPALLTGAFGFLESKLNDLKKLYALNEKKKPE